MPPMYQERRDNNKSANMERAGAPNQAKFVVKSKSPRAGGLQMASGQNYTRKAMH